MTTLTERLKCKWCRQHGRTVDSTCERTGYKCAPVIFTRDLEVGDRLRYGGVIFEIESEPRTATHPMGEDPLAGDPLANEVDWVIGVAVDVPEDYCPTEDSPRYGYLYPFVKRVGDTWNFQRRADLNVCGIAHDGVLEWSA